jgi:hypothetical protein
MRTGALGIANQTESAHARTKNIGHSDVVNVFTPRDRFGAALAVQSSDYDLPKSLTVLARLAISRTRDALKTAATHQGASFMTFL